jgi:galactokinase
MSPPCAVFAPGRVNLIGEHTDYSEGLVLPVAVAFGVTVRGEAAHGSIRLRSLALPGTVDLGLDGTPQADLPGWGRYAGAVTRLLAERGRPEVGLDGVIESTVPIGSGLSSSAALTVSIALALCRVAAFNLPRLELARLVQQAELRAVGVPCGLMDPAVSLLAKRGNALLLDCATERWRLVHLAAEIGIVVLDSGIRHNLEHSGYSMRRAELERGLVALDGKRPAELALEDALAAARAAGIDEVAVRRLRHVVSENQRVRELVTALESPEAADRQRIGHIMRESHQSLRDDFEVSTPELDQLVDLAYEHGALGARLTGGGFGGSVVALTDRPPSAQFVASVKEAYRAGTGRELDARVCATADGAGDAARKRRP